MPRRKKKNNYRYIEEPEEYYHHSKFKLKIDKSNIKEAGKGVFTEEHIPKNTFIDYYNGDISRTRGWYYVEIDDDYGINAIGFPRCYMAMINDSYKSPFTNNCEMRINNKKIEIWSITDIQPKEELFMDYGDEYWN